MTTNYSGQQYPAFPPDTIIAENLSQTTSSLGATTTSNNLNGQVPLVVRSGPITTDLSIFSGNWAADGTSSLADGQGVNGYTPVGWFNFLNASYDSAASIPCVNFGTSFNITPTSETYSGGCRIAWMGPNYTGGQGQNKAEFYLPGGNGARIRLNGGYEGSKGNVVIGNEVSLNDIAYSFEDTTYALKVVGSGSFTSQSSSTTVLELSGAPSQAASVLSVNDDTFSVNNNGSVSLQGLSVGITYFTNTLSTTKVCTLYPDVNTIFTSGNITTTLLSAATYPGLEQTFIKRDSSATTLIINSPSGETINGNTMLTITAQYTSASFISDGSNWYIK